MRVSVIIPTYNRAAYLQEALESILQQTLPPSEIIVVDDGSTDDTEEVVRGACRPVLFYRQEHRGVAAARNLGLQMATGDLIAWLDSDDLWEPAFLATVVPLLAQDETLDGVYTGITTIDSGGARLGTSVRVERPEKLHDALVRGNFLATPSIVAARACYDQVGGFDPQFRICEDYDMWLTLTERFRLAGISRPLVRIRVHPTNTMADVDALAAAGLAVARKHFGEMGDPSEQSDASRLAHGYTFRSIAIQYIEHGQPTRGWAYMAKSAECYPEILSDLDTLYELALGDQPRGYRGQAGRLDLDASAAEILTRLDTLFTQASPAVAAQRRTAYGNAYLALGMLSDQAGDWSAARGYLFKALHSNARLLKYRGVARRLSKVMAGRTLVTLAHRVLGCHNSSGLSRPSAMEG